MTDKADDTEIKVQLAVLSTKLDGLHTLLADKLTAMDRRITVSEEELRSDLKHLRANTVQMFEGQRKTFENEFVSIRKELDGKVSAVEFEPIRKTFWGGVMGVLSSIGMALLALWQNGHAG